MIHRIRRQVMCDKRLIIKIGGYSPYLFGKFLRSKYKDQSRSNF